MSPRRVLASIGLAIGGSLSIVILPLHADPATAGFRIAPFLTGSEYIPSLEPDGAGGAYVGFARDPLKYQVAHVLADGSPDPAWTTWILSGLNYSASFPPRFRTCIAPLGDGTVWVFSNWALTNDLFFRLTLGTGENPPEIHSGNAARNQFASIAIAGTLGRTLVLSRAGSANVHPAVLHSNGVLEDPPPPVIGLGGTENSSSPAPVGIPDGAGGAHLVVEVTDHNTGSGSDLIAVRFQPDGTAAWTPPTRAISDVSRNQSDPSVVSDGAGGAFYAWADERNLSTATDAYLQHVLADGSVAPGFVNDGKAIAAYPAQQASVRVAADGAGGVWLVWRDGRSGENDIYFTHLDTQGLPTPGFPAGGRPLCDAPGGQIDPVVSADGDGGIFVAWVDERDGELDLYGQHVHNTGVVMPGWQDGGLPLCTNAFSPSSLELVTSSPGHAIVAWIDFRDVQGHIFAMAFPPDGDVTSVPTVGPPRLALSPVTVPARGFIELEITAPGPEDVTLSLLDVSGRRLEEVRVRGPVQSSRVRFTRAVPAPGLYLVTASQCGRMASTRIAALR